MRWFKKTGLAKSILKRLPVGFSVAPFEFVVFFSYGLWAAKYLIDIMTGRGRQDLVALAALPLHGDALNFWLAMLFVGCVSICAGLLVNGYRPILGLRLERAGLTSAGAMISFYLYEIYNLVGFSLSIGFITLIALLVATVYKVAAITQTLDVLTERKGKTP